MMENLKSGGQVEDEICYSFYNNHDCSSIRHFMRKNTAERLLGFDREVTENVLGHENMGN